MITTAKHHERCSEAYQPTVDELLERLGKEAPRAGRGCVQRWYGGILWVNAWAGELRS